MTSKEVIHLLTEGEVNKLFDLLAELHGKNKPRDRRTVAIWATVLEPWSYPQVRDAAVKRSRGNRYYPDPAELAGLLPPPVEIRAAPATQVGENWMARFSRRWDAAMEKKGQPPTLAQAMDGGMTAEEWWRLRGAVMCDDGEWMAALSPGQREELRRKVFGKQEALEVTT